MKRKKIGVMTGLALPFALMINASNLPDDTSQRLYQLQFFSCKGHNRDLLIKVEGSSTENQDYFAVTMTTSIDPRSAVTYFWQPERKAERRFTVLSVNEEYMELLSSFGRTTTLLEIHFAPDALSYIDDGSVFFWQSLQCDVVQISKIEQEEPRHNHLSPDRERSANHE